MDDDSFHSKVHIPLRIAGQSTTTYGNKQEKGGAMSLFLMEKGFDENYYVGIIDNIVVKYNV